MKIIVDAFGGDNSPAAVLKGAEMAAKEGAEIILTGDREKIKSAAAENGVDISGMEILDASTVISPNDEPTEVMKSFSDCSITVGLKALRDGVGEAFVSAGSTGAVMVGATLIVKRIPKIKRPAIATLIPTSEGKPFMLIDTGANAECRPEMLTQFGLMGHVYMNRVMKVESPRVALVNNGAEEHKGPPLQQAAYQLMKEAPYNFIGNIEARDVPLYGCDVAVADGFTGNVILKMMEGMGSFMSRQLKAMFTASFMTKLAALSMKKQLDALKKKMDYAEYGGGLLMGVAKPVVKAHGSSNAWAIRNAILQARSFAQTGVIGIISEEILKLKEESTDGE